MPIRQLVKISQLRKRYGSFEVLKGVDLEVSEGEKVSIIGPSGSGKTTLLRSIGYLERPTSGYIEIDGERIGQKIVNGRYVDMSDRELARVRAGIGMVFQRFNLFPHLTAMENVMLGPVKVRHLPRDEAEARAVDLLTKVGLHHKMRSYPEHMSGGQQQRVAIARSLAMQPKLMLFDEATSALDPELIGEVLSVIRRLAENNMTMIIVTHEMTFAQNVSDKVIVMEQGEIIDQGPPDQLFRSPSHPRAREFMKAVLAERGSKGPAGIAF